MTIRQLAERLMYIVHENDTNGHADRNNLEMMVFIHRSERKRTWVAPLNNVIGGLSYYYPPDSEPVRCTNINIHEDDIIKEAF
jgi:hypothetical protein